MAHEPIPAYLLAGPRWSSVLHMLRLTRQALTQPGMAVATCIRLASSCSNSSSSAHRPSLNGSETAAAAGGGDDDTDLAGLALTLAQLYRECTNTTVQVCTAHVLCIA